MTHDDSIPRDPDDQIGPVTGSEHFHKGVELFEQGKLAEALDHIDRALELLHVDADVCMIKGQILFEMKLPDDALGWLGRAAQLNPVSADIQLWRGRAQHILKRYRAALASFNRVLEFDPLNVDAHINRGMALVELGDLDRATDALETAREHSVGDGMSDREHEVEYWLARIDRAHGDLESARGRLEKVVEMRPNYVSAVAELGDLLRAAPRSDEDLQQAKAAYEAGLAAEPNDPALLNDYGNLLRELQDLQGSLEHLTRAIKENPDHEVAWFNRGLTHEEIGDHEGAAHDFSEAVRIDETDIDARLKIADNQLALEHFDDALAQVEAVLELDPGHTEAILVAGDILNRRALALEAAGDFIGAAASLRTLIDLAPDLVNVDGFEHWFDDASARHRHAVRGYQALLKADPTSTDYGLMLGLHLVREQEFLRASVVLEDHTRRSPDDAFAWVLRAICASETNDPATAVAFYDRALALLPSWVELLWEKAILLESDALNDLEGAIRCYEGILASSAEHRWCHEPLARLYDETGDPVQALKHLRLYDGFLSSIRRRDRLEGPLHWVYGRIRLALGQPLAAVEHLELALEAADQEKLDGAEGAAADTRRMPRSMNSAAVAPEDSDEPKVHRGEVLLLLGQAQLALGRLPEARASLDESLAEAASDDDPGLAVDVRTTLAGIAIREGRLDDADRFLAEAARDIPRQSREQLLTRANLEFRRGNDTRAREYLDRVIIRSPRRDVTFLDALLLQARIAWRQDDLFLALEAVDEILATEPLYVHAAALKVWLARAVGQEREATQARRDFRMASTFARAARALQEGRAQDALDLLSRYRGESWVGRSEFCFLRAAAEARLDRVAEACEQLQRAISLDPSLADEVHSEPSFDSLLGDPRFEQALTLGVRRERPISKRRPTPDELARTADAEDERPQIESRSDADLLRDAEFGIDWDSLGD